MAVSLLLTGLFLAMFAILCLLTPAVFSDRWTSKMSKYSVLFALVVAFALVLAIVAVTAPRVGEGRPDTSLFEEGQYRIIAVGQVGDGQIELLLSEVEHVSNGKYGLRYYQHGTRYYKLDVDKLGLTTFGEELEGQWLVVEKLKGYDYKIVPGK